MPTPLQNILVSDTPLLDVRAEIEFSAGSFPSATNIPIMNDAERERIGICYKTKGPDAAEKLGHELVSGSVRDSRTNAWCEFIDAHPNTQIFCFRGGLRSQIAQQWLKESGYEVARINGGYKALRRSLLAVFEDLPNLLVVAGKTGTGKTEFLARVSNKVDLEKRANHRGSAFGKQLTEQPAQINFENKVAIDFLKLSTSPVLIEDESRLIGRINLPLPLQAKMSEAPIILLEDSLENRVQRINKEYLFDQMHELVTSTDSVEVAHEKLRLLFLTALDLIKKRLGQERYANLSELMKHAFEIQRQGDFSAHNDWIRLLLEDYYDPMYEYQLSKKRARVIDQGDQESLLKYAANILTFE
ncbi:MAG: tRNA 2-selenouridine synthase [Candidatus Azotimanducaceae bacterium]|jgi:tRNA 2-selenouridine synthase